MGLTQLQIENVRNLRLVKLQDLQSVNVFHGCNGSGKTSLLESIHLLGMARSFRGSSIRTLITHGGQSCTVYGKALRQGALRSDAELSGVAEPVGLGLSLGVRRERNGDAQIRIGGRAVRTVAELAAQLPLQVITADSFGLLTGSPQARRQFLDWGVFHVEQRFFGQWQRFQRSIKQRNQLLRRGKMSRQEFVIWSRDLAETGTAINDYRQSYFQTLSPRFKVIMDSLAPGLGPLELQYRQGWDSELSYQDALEVSLPADLEQGYTRLGPQRGDIKVTVDGYSAAETLSRGQQKLVVCGLKLAQGQLISERGPGTCTYLIDDLPSELDRRHNERVCALLAAMEAQVFITCVDVEDVRAVWPQSATLSMFHVEQGDVSASY